MVIDRDILSQRVTADGQVAAYGVIVNGVAGADVTTYDWATWPMDKRVAEAKKLLADAGVAPGTKLKFAYNTSEYHKKMAIFAASEWKTKLGIDLEMEAMEFKVLIKKRNDGDNQSLDPAKRKTLLTQAAKIIMEDYPMIPLLQYTVPRLVKSYVGGYSATNSMDRYRAKDLYIIKH